MIRTRAWKKMLHVILTYLIVHFSSTIKHYKSKGFFFIGLHSWATMKRNYSKILHRKLHTMCTIYTHKSPYAFMLSRYSTLQGMPIFRRVYNLTCFSHPHKFLHSLSSMHIVSEFFVIEVPVGQKSLWKSTSYEKESL